MGISQGNTKVVVYGGKSSSCLTGTQVCSMYQMDMAIGDTINTTATHGQPALHTQQVIVEEVVTYTPPKRCCAAKFLCFQLNVCFFCLFVFCLVG